jgi:hypothetical protein
LPAPAAVLDSWRAAAWIPGFQRLKEAKNDIHAKAEL